MTTRGLYYVETTYGCGIKQARNIASVRRILAMEVGTDNVKSIRKATSQDLAWVRGMGGRIPGGAK